ncbi:MAG: hypothetical protein V2A65_10435 [Candidatus Omnitrophota bacterium]
MTLKRKTIAVPSLGQLAWQDMEMGMFIHFAPNTYQNEQLDNLSTPLSEINPEGLDVKQWKFGLMVVPMGNWSLRLSGNTNPGQWYFRAVLLQFAGLGTKTG